MSGFFILESLYQPTYWGILKRKILQYVAPVGVSDLLFQWSVFLTIRQVAWALRTMSCPVFLANKLSDVGGEAVPVVARRGTVFVL